MSPSSFKKGLGPPPPRYRTPSPPRFAFEPLSPINTIAEGVAHRQSESNLQNGVKRPFFEQPVGPEKPQTQKHDAQGTMETFASIALATSRPSPFEGDSISACPTFELTQMEEPQGTERPSKRARSEKAYSPEWARTGSTTDTRPATSYEHSSDSRTFEAELLLNLSHEARFSKPWEINVQISTHSSRAKNEISLQTLDETSPYHSDPIDSYNQDNNIKMSNISANESEVEKILNGNESGTLSDALIVNPQHAQTRITSQISPSKIHTRENADEVCMSQDPKSNFIPENSNILHLSNNVIIDYTQTLKYPAMTPSVGLEAETAQSLDTRPIAVRNEPVELEEFKMQLSINTTEDEKVAKDFHGISETAESQKQSDTSDLGHSSHIPDEAIPTQADVYDQDLADPAPISSTASATCSACHFTRNSSQSDSEISSTSWISCDGCKSWFHFACAGFKSEREVRSVDKYRCQKCKPVHGSTTYVRKSSRAHSAIDYAGLNEGVLKTSDERPEHHYIKPLKEGIITFLPENFARMRPELVTAEFFEKGNGMKEPVVIPAYLNPQPTVSVGENSMNVHQKGIHSTLSLQDSSLIDEWLLPDTEFQTVSDQGQDALDMVMPRNLTVRMVANLYGPEEKVEVIDVKSQNGESKKWNMRRWADYYESSSDKAVRNVISLEVSNSKLGRLIRRPQIVRDLDLQDSVWPQELLARGEYPRVQLYCLMSVADCFTDFHIDFGGSSVFYHILKGKKTFLFIPPKEKHLKKYEEWCMSPAQNWTFLADQTKECYRVDLMEGDTMLIPAGWIHAVWTPEDSLVIGGNFLTRMHYGMQIRIAQLEKATGVARKFRYPHFQKLHWYTALRYMEDDPLPESLKAIFREGGKFHRDQPAHYSFDEWGENSISGLENYHARYYAQSELEGLPDLTRYLLRTALIDIGSITEGITAEMRNAVKRAIPRGYGEPLDVIKDFAMWCAWKRGNEPIPYWAYPHAVYEGSASDSVGKLSAAALKKLDQETTLQAPRRQSARRRSQQQLLSTATISGFSDGLNGTPDRAIQGAQSSACVASSETPTASNTPLTEKPTDTTTQGLVDISPSDTSKRPRKPTKTGIISHRKPACDSCRKRRRACKHRDQTVALALDHRMLEPTDNAVPEILGSNTKSLLETADLSLKIVQAHHDGNEGRLSTGETQESFRNSNDESLPTQSLKVFSSNSDFENDQEQNLQPHQNYSLSTQVRDTISLDKSSGPVSIQHTLSPNGTMHGLMSKEFDPISGNSPHNRGRTKACNDCRKSKVNIFSPTLLNLDADLAQSGVVYMMSMGMRIQPKLAKPPYRG